MTPTGYFLEHLWLIPLFPLATASLMLLVGRRLRKSAVSLFCVGSVGVSFAYALGAVTQLLSAPPENRVVQHILFEWLAPGQMLLSSGHVVPFTADWGYLLDPLSSVMVLVVTGVGFLIHVYSIGYMGHEGGYYRFFGYMNLFMFSMLTLVLANNMLLMFVGWEGVGLCSYLLIGFYFLKKSASDAGKKAFIVNRIGDAGFILGILLTAVTLGTIRFTSQGLPDVEGASGILQALQSAVNTHTLAFGAPVLTGIALLLFIGAIGKSAQIPLYVWLPDAMEGPTPVSALIHAATMVTAGVYMVARMNAIYQLAPFAMDVVAVVGAVTAIFAASMALVQNDIKKVLAYSTISQLGYMFLALGVGAFAAGIFHLMTHAFFKALLFLGAGSVIHAMSGEQDLQKMGGLWGEIPVTARTCSVDRRFHHRRHDCVLHVPIGVPHVFRLFPCRQSRAKTHSRIAANDDHPPDDSCGAFRGWRMDRLARILVRKQSVREVPRTRNVQRRSDGVREGRSGELDHGIFPDARLHRHCGGRHLGGV